MEATGVTVTPAKLAAMPTGKLDSLIRSQSSQCSKLQQEFTRKQSTRLYPALLEMESRFEKRERFRTDLKKLNAATWHGYLKSVGIQPAAYRQWKHRSGLSTPKPVVASNVSVIADTLIRDIESSKRKSTLESVVAAASALNPPIRKNLARALTNVANDMLNAAKSLSTVVDPPAERKCHQRVRREQMALLPDPDLPEKLRLAADFKKNATWREISHDEAKALILENEYLGTYPGGVRFRVGLFIGRFLAGVECFGAVGGTHVAESICGKEHKDRVLTIVRGTMAHWAPKDAGSFLLSKACKMMAEKGHNVICAFADPAANEVGTIYSATNFQYCGMTQPTEQFITPDGKKHDSRKIHSMTRDRRGGGLRYVRTRKEQKQLLMQQGCKFMDGNAKHRFVLISGSDGEKKLLRKALLWKPQPHPKRELVA